MSPGSGPLHADGGFPLAVKSKPGVEDSQREHGRHDHRTLQGHEETLVVGNAAGESMLQLRHAECGTHNDENCGQRQCWTTTVSDQVEARKGWGQQKEARTEQKQLESAPGGDGHKDLVALAAGLVRMRQANSAQSRQNKTSETS